MYQDELTMDLKDLCRRCLEKWKILLVCMLIGAILADGAGALMSVKKVKEAKAQLAQQQTEKDAKEKLITLKEYMSELTDREISDVQTAFSCYKSYQQEYINGLAYCQNSIRMQLNPTKIPTLRLGYVIDNHYEVVYPIIAKRDTTDAIINALAEQIHSEAISQQIAEIVGLTADKTAYAQELISSELKNRDMLFFSIVAKNKEDCQKIADIIKQTMDEQAPTVRMSCGDFELTLVTEQYMEETNTDLMNEKQNRMMTLNNLKNSINNLTAGMSEEQLTYYKALCDNEDSIVIEDTETEQATVETEEQVIVVPQTQYVNLKWIGMGAILGLFIGCIWIALVYVVCNALRVSADMEDAMGIAVLGNITDKNKKKLHIFKTRYDDFDTDKQLQMAVTKISTMMEKEKISKVFVGSTGETEKIQQVCEEIKSRLGEKNISCKEGFSLLYDTDSVKNMAEMDAAVLIEQIDVSKYDEIRKTKELSAKCHVPIMGCLVIE